PRRDAWRRRRSWCLFSCWWVCSWRSSPRRASETRRSAPPPKGRGARGVRWWDGWFRRPIVGRLLMGRLLTGMLLVPLLLAGCGDDDDGPAAGAGRVADVAEVAVADMRLSAAGDLAAFYDRLHPELQ